MVCILTFLKWFSLESWAFETALNSRKVHSRLFIKRNPTRRGWFQFISSVFFKGLDQIMAGDPIHRLFSVRLYRSFRIPWRQDRYWPLNIKSLKNPPFFMSMVNELSKITKSILELKVSCAGGTTGLYRCDTIY